eukprot:CAMPEP_0206618686 /NCGR_PEP_ID=MMETSP0325_2-20121206/60412_1 /ASSEMBLY_ACC=CAM_ASM_000347 /TAXON_ID=2866 /ORGANISM="Crypthecodinium cohnii, Strain Seligo" /LENGTH=58 /DNA_ID=CAMNT_0054140975 /DNA_START=52 /DNA_END=224 /DNA_ORIENTATION=+
MPDTSSIARCATSVFVLSFKDFFLPPTADFFEFETQRRGSRCQVRVGLNPSRCPSPRA